MPSTQASDRCPAMGAYLLDGREVIHGPASKQPLKRPDLVRRGSDHLNRRPTPSKSHFGDGLWRNLQDSSHFCGSSGENQLTALPLLPWAHRCKLGV